MSQHSLPPRCRTVLHFFFAVTAMEALIWSLLLHLISCLQCCLWAVPRVLSREQVILKQREWLSSCLLEELRSLLLCCGTSQIVILIVSLCICYSQWLKTQVVRYLTF